MELEDIRPYRGRLLENVSIPIDDLCLSETSGSASCVLDLRSDLIRSNRILFAVTATGMSFRIPHETMIFSHMEMLLLRRVSVIQ